MKVLFSIFCFVMGLGICSSLYSQTNDSTRQNVSFDLVYGQKFYKNAFYEAINSQKNISLGGNPRLIGLQQSGAIPYKKLSNKFVNFTNSVTKILPYDLLVNDTIKGKLSGFNFGCTLLGYDCFPKNRTIDFDVIFGFNTGRVKIYDNDLIRSHNPYFSPKITIFPRITIKRFTISLLAEYEQDISKAGWKKMRFGKAGSVNVNGFDQTGYSFYFGIGYRIAEGTDKKDGD